MKFIPCIALLVFIQVTEGWWSSRRRRNPPPPGPPPPPPSDCEVDDWSSWSECTHQCGIWGSQTRTREKSEDERYGGKCPFELEETSSCNRHGCSNGGRLSYGRCICSSGWTGTCCDRGSYTCSCVPCYTKYGTRCQLRQCRISGTCYSYGRVNPWNQCQDCQSWQKTAWTNNNALSCSDGKLCTRNDRCVNGACIGTPFTCRSCERCDGSGCQIKPGFCVIDGKCYTDGNIRPGKPCQVYLTLTDKTFNLQTPTIDRVHRLLKTTDEKKSVGLDKIPNKLLKMAADVIAPSLTEIFTKSIHTGIFPDEWKEAMVSPVYKNGAKHDPSNYRPISVIPTVSKIF
ncbi:Hypothetical predicted protein [Paramuricea clavata]|uniref:Uncharacterized protein n=1 Tax=Paramuricea clavata TaxID=317549 RepID=A0A7D9E6V8_PARCT|nr:Hypothetical predicted protein [Paramuricea clavata]